jgi:succinate dehydrogenase / fumarate reductase cytochrome b subunit
MANPIRNIGLGSIVNYKFPIMAIVSILHRISGVLLFLFTPFLIWVFDLSLRSANTWQCVANCIATHGFVRFLIWVFLSALSYHFLAGIRHLVMDTGHWESLQGGKIASRVVMALAIVVIVILGVWLW